MKTGHRLAWLGALASIVGCVGDIGGDGNDPWGVGQWASENGTMKYGVDVSVWTEEITDAELACLYQKGVRHVVVGTQNERIARQQLSAALEGGMSVDLYVYLHWDWDMQLQVEHALSIAQSFPVGRIWLDAEEQPAGLSASQLHERLADALAACGSMPCGIYTAEWWWSPAMNGSTAFNDVPLWYAHYDHDPSVATWSTQSFGGWAQPAGKQFSEGHLCGVLLDENTIGSLTASPPPPAPKAAPNGPAPSPTGLYPDDGVQVLTERTRLICDQIPETSTYHFEIEQYQGGAWKHYYDYVAYENGRQFNPVDDNRVYRWRVRADNAHGTGAWSDWAWFEFGQASELPANPTEPSSEDPTEEPAPKDAPSEPPPEDDPSSDDPPKDDESQPDKDPVSGSAPTGISPADGSSTTGSSIVLSCDAVSGASQYEFEIQYDLGSGYVPYFDYQPSSPSKIFWPATSATYRWRVRAQTGQGWTAASSWSSFSH